MPNRRGNSGKGDAPRRGAPPKLVLPTLNDKRIASSFFSERPQRPHFEVRVRDFGDGAVELVAFRGDLMPRPRRKLVDEEIKERVRVRSEMDETTRDSADARARKLLRHRVMMMRADRLLTLTYRENKTDLKACWRDLQKFVRYMKSSFPDFFYVVVPERQDRGAWHFHLAVKGFYNVNLVRYHWRKAICGDGKGDVGTINITSPRRGPQWQRGKLSSYLAKYIGKDFGADEQMYSRRFASSQSIPAPISHTYFVPYGDASFYAMTLLLREYNPRGVARCFESAGPTVIWWMASY